jgi:hypothetical protein
MLSYTTYTATQGIPFERLVIVRERRTHRVVRPLECWGRIKTGDISVAPLTTQITSEGGILISLTAEQTKDLPLGDLEFDIIAKTYKNQSLVYGSLTTYGPLTSGETVTQPVIKGTIKVSALDTVTSLEEDSQVEIRFKKGTDFRSVYSWTDSDGALVSIRNAILQAKNASGALVLTINWFASTPTEATIVALPATQRGYIAPFANATMELHISDSNTIAAGTYKYDILVQEQDADWKPLVAGSLVVEESISTRPT